MRILIVGAGPAGLYFGYLMKRQNPDAEIRIVEQNPADSTFGFGVVFSERALDFLREDDLDTYSLLVAEMETWRDLTLVHRKESVTIDGIGFTAIARLKLLQVMQQRLAAHRVIPEYNRTITSAKELDGYDLVVAADGANSFVRKCHEAQFGTTLTYLKNKFVWYGTTKRFESLTQTFIETEHGGFNAHHYRYAPGMSTFLVECDPATWQRAGFENLDESATREFCERIFAETLDGHPLVTNKSVWRNFPKVSNQHWTVGNKVLVGDALRTAHFSIGSGTRLAFDDVIALAKACNEHPKDIASALAAYEAARRPIVDKLVTAANTSAEWYEHFREHMKLSPWDLAWSYIQRSGRIDIEKLKKMSPRFVDGYMASRQQEAS
ncbi:MAG: FAD-dependent monooxygenase [Pseudomonadota bacterium]